MMRKSISCCVVAFVVGSLGASAMATLHGQESSQKGNWTQWRGPLGTGESPSAKPPVRWSETENLRWKTAIPGRGHSTPIVWQDHVFVTTAIPVGEKFEPRADNRPGSHDNLKVEQAHQFAVVALDRTNGEILWSKVVHQVVPREGSHYTGSLASASPVTDGKHLYAFFGSYGLYCLDFDGAIVWKKEFEQMHTKHGHGEGASPALFGDTIIVNWDHEEDSFIVSLDKTNGNELWKKERAEVTSWSSPIVVEHSGRPQAVVAGTHRARGYDLESGEVIWECGGLSNNVVATPVAGNGIVYFGSSYESKAVFGVKLEGATGDITGTEHVVWRHEQRTPYVPSPLLYDGKLYYLRHYQGILTRLDAESGEETIGPFRLAGMREIYASPVGADDKLYFVDRSGVTLVVSHSQIPKVLGLNRLDDEINASPALVDDEIFLRGAKSLYCIGK